jgi:tetratricopeptide (TPR) repeat protein
MGGRQNNNQAGSLLSLAGGQTGPGAGVLSLLTGQLLGGVGSVRRPQDRRSDTEFEASTNALTLKDVILKEAKEQGADAILIGEVLNYKCEDMDPRFHLLPREGTGIVGATVGLMMVPLEMAINVGEWGLNKVGRIWGRVPPAIERTGQVQVACRVIDLRTNSVRMSSEPYQVEIARAEKDALLPPEELVLGHALDKCARELASGMSGAPEMMRMEMVTTPQLRVGVDHARQGRLQQARIEFERALYDDPSDHGACYNIGVLEEARGDFELAARYYAAALATQPNEKYVAAVDRVRSRQDHARDLQAQMLAAPPSGPAAVLPASTR